MKWIRDRAARNKFLEEALPHMAALFRTALRMTRNRAQAEDLVQETYTEAWKSFHRYELGTNCKAWLFRILYRVRGKQIRESVRAQEVLLEEAPLQSLTVQPGSEARIRYQEVLQLLASLPDHYQEVLVLADVEGFSYREIAEMLETPLGTVMSRLNRARSLLREKLDREQARSAGTGR